jgi:hypothetical protein
MSHGEWMFKCDACGESGVFVSTRVHACTVCGVRRRFCPGCEKSKANTYLMICNVANEIFEVDSEKCLNEYVAHESSALWKKKFFRPFSRLEKSASLDDLKNPEIEHAKQTYKDFKLFYNEHDLFGRNTALLIWNSLKEKMDNGWMRFAANLETAGRIEDAAKVHEYFGHFNEAGRIRQTMNAKQIGITEIRTGTIQIHSAPIQQANIDQRDQSITSTVVKDSVISRSSIGTGRPFTICPYCGEALDLPKTPKYCPYCKEQLAK